MPFFCKGLPQLVEDCPMKKGVGENFRLEMFGYPGGNVRSPADGWVEVVQAFSWYNALFFTSRPEHFSVSNDEFFVINWLVYLPKYWSNCRGSRVKLKLLPLDWSHYCYLKSSTWSGFKITQAHQRHLGIMYGNINPLEHFRYEIKHASVEIALPNRIQHRASTRSNQWEFF